MNAMEPIVRIPASYRTYISAISEFWNGCFPIAETLEVSSPHCPVRAAFWYSFFPAEFIFVHVGVCASVLSTKHANPMA